MGMKVRGRKRGIQSKKDSKKEEKKKEKNNIFFFQAEDGIRDKGM